MQVSNEATPLQFKRKKKKEKEKKKRKRKKSVNLKFYTQQK